MDEYFPALSLEEDGPPFETAALMGDANALWLEIGFGAGEHLVWQAKEHPSTAFVGVEPFLTGVAKCVTAVAAADLKNIKLCAGDARRLLARFPAACVERVFILHPDPWPKWRHAKRRLIQTDFLTELARVMQPGGILRLGTDWPDYSVWALHHILKHPSFTWCDERAADWQVRRDDWPFTRYARKAEKQGRRDVHLTFQRAANG